MNQPIIAVYTLIKDEQIAELEEMASNYRIIKGESILEGDYQDIEIIYGWNKKFTLNDLEQMKNLKWIQKESAGLDSLPEEIKENEDVLISNMSGIHATGISENVYGYLLAQVRGIFAFQPSRARHEWKHDLSDSVKSLSDKTIMIYGTGSIGSEIARIARAFSMNIVGVNTNGRDIEGFESTVSFDEAINSVSKADVIVNSMPLTEVNRGYFDLPLFKKMKNTALFVNIGRGESVNEADLYKALTEGEIESAYSDVFSKEPLPKDSPLWDVENLIITPHTAGSVEHFQDATFEIFIKNLKQYLKEGTLAINEYNRKKKY